MNNQKPTIETSEFKNLLLNFWNEQEFRTQTFMQISKDFALSGINLSTHNLNKCSSQLELEQTIVSHVNDKNINTLLYIVDLHDELNNREEELARSIITRVAFKVFLRTYFDSNQSS